MSNPKPRPQAGQSSLDLDAEVDSVPSEPVDTDDNDEPFADASGDSEDESPDENEAPDEWLEGEA